MNYQRFVVAFLITAVLSLIGCSSSKESSENQKATTQKEAEKAPPQSPDVAPKVDTVTVDRQDTQRPVYDQKNTIPSPTPTGRFTVQVGAYKMPDNADRVASLARERFGRNVYTILDKADNLYKVMIGDFPTKDEARNFRDEMVQKFSSDYKGAWVSENNQK